MLYEVPVYRAGGHWQIAPPDQWISYTSDADCLATAAGDAPVEAVRPDQFPVPYTLLPQGHWRLFRYLASPWGWQYFALREDAAPSAGDR